MDIEKFTDILRKASYTEQIYHVDNIFRHNGDIEFREALGDNYLPVVNYVPLLAAVIIIRQYGIVEFYTWEDEYITSINIDNISSFELINEYE